MKNQQNDITHIMPQPAPADNEERGRGRGSRLTAALMDYGSFTLPFQHSANLESLITCMGRFLDVGRKPEGLDTTLEWCRRPTVQLQLKLKYMLNIPCMLTRLEHQE